LYFEEFARAEEHVLQFQVGVDEVHRVEEGEGLEDLPGDGDDRPRREGPVVVEL